MLIERFYDEKLAQASYLVGCVATGEALVIDPNRDVAQYRRVAEAKGLRITHVTETHIHADFVSGSRELAAATGAQLFLSDEGDAEWKYEYARDAGATLVKDGDSFMVGNIAVRVLHTPGHTPEHVSFMIIDTPATSEPIGVFTGDFIFAGDVGRPDLLEKAAKIAGTMEAGARTLYRSLQTFKALPDYLQLWPGHGAGSACGKALGAIPSTTLGYERIANWGLADLTEEEFVDQVLAGQPEPPRYFATMKHINKCGPRILGGHRRVARLHADTLAAVLGQGATVVDTRPAPDYAAGFIPGTLNIPLNRSFTTWAGWLLSYERPFYLLVDDTSMPRVDEALRDLAMIGLDDVVGYVGRDAIDEWTSAGRELDSVPQMSPDALSARLAAGELLDVIDVRGAAEWHAGHLPGARHIPLGDLVDRVHEIPSDRPVVVQCQGGARSAIAASVLKAYGRSKVVNLSGGFASWLADGHPAERGERANRPRSG